MDKYQLHIWNFKNQRVWGNTWFLRQLWYMEASLWWMVAARYWHRGCRSDTVSTSQYFKDFIMASLTSFSIYNRNKYKFNKKKKNP